MKMHMPIPHKIPFTKEGYENLKNEKTLLDEKRKETIISLSRAREMGDLSENALYKAAKMELGGIDRRLRRNAHLIRYAEITEVTKHSGVQIGSDVLIHDGDKTRELHIVGGYESNPSEGKISHISPIGKGLLGKRIGDVIDVETPRGKVRYKIIKIG